MRRQTPGQAANGGAACPQPPSPAPVTADTSIDDDSSSVTRQECRHPDGPHRFGEPDARWVPPAVAAQLATGLVHFPGLLLTQYMCAGYGRSKPKRTAVEDPDSAASSAWVAWSAASTSRRSGEHTDPSTVNSDGTTTIDTASSREPRRASPEQPDHSEGTAQSTSPPQSSARHRPAPKVARATRQPHLDPWAALAATRSVDTAGIGTWVPTPSSPTGLSDFDCSMSSAASSCSDSRTGEVSMPPPHTYTYALAHNANVPWTPFTVVNSANVNATTTLGPAHLRLGGVCGEVPAAAIAYAVWEMTGVQVRAAAVFKPVFGLAVLWLSDREREAPIVMSRMDRRAWMNRDAMFWVPLSQEPADVEEREALEQRLLALDAFTTTIPKGSRQPRRLLTCTPWESGGSPGPSVPSLAGGGRRRDR